MPLFVICLLAFAAGMLLFLAGKLLTSYPLVFLGVVCSIGASVCAIIDGEAMLGIMWLIFSAISALTAALHFYRNNRGAFWWCLGAVLGMAAAAVPYNMINEDMGDVLTIFIPLVIFVVIGLIGSIFVPRLVHRDRNERKHLTNLDPMIGKLVKVVTDADGEFPARAICGDVDWSVKPFFPFESFKAGDVVKVQKIEGVTLLCSRDGKDLRHEIKSKRAKEKAEAKAAREAAKAAKKEKKGPVEEPKPAPAPVVEEPKPIEEPAPAPVVEEPAPVVEEPKPVEEPAPVVEEKPAKEKAEFVPFAVRMKKADKELKETYNELKSEILSYGIKSRVSSTGDTFRLHTKTYVKMVIAGKSLKLYLALDPKDYKDTTYPFDDASKMSAHKDTPFVFKIKSALSVRRAKVLIGDAAKKDGLTQGEVVKHDHAKDVK